MLGLASHTHTIAWQTSFPNTPATAIRHNAVAMTTIRSPRSGAYLANAPPAQDVSSSGCAFTPSRRGASFDRPVLIPENNGRSPDPNQWPGTRLLAGPIGTCR